MQVAFSGGSVSGTIDNFTKIPFGQVTETPVAGSFSMSGSSTGNNSLLSPAISGFASGSLEGVSDLMSFEGSFAGPNGRNGQLQFIGSSWIGFGYVEAN